MYYYMTSFNKKLEHDNLQILLRDSYNEGEEPSQIINKKFSYIIKENMFYVLILILILIIVFIRITNKSIITKKPDEIESDDLYVPKKKEKYSTPHEYYTNYPRIK